MIITEVLTTLFSNWEIVLLFLFVAILYSSVGFGGGSSYLAILSLTSLGFTQIRAIALLCNIVVVSNSTLIYSKNKFYNWKKVIPLVVFSIPMAFLGGFLKINQSFFFILLGFTLIIAAVFMWMSKFITAKSSFNHSKKNLLRDISFGGIIGFISGMVGIGGGIFLAPLLHLTNWDSPKKITATSSFFILVNSIAGLIGQYQNPSLSFDFKLITLLLTTVFIGGQIGSRLNTRTFSPYFIKNITAILIVTVGLRILWKHFF